MLDEWYDYFPVVIVLNSCYNAYVNLWKLEAGVLRYTNRQVAEIFNQIADLSEIKGEVIYRVLAYRKAADSIANLGRDINEVWQAGELQEIPGVGQAIADKISDLLGTGRMTFYDKLTAEVPLSLVDVLHIPDVGPKKARAMWQELGLTSVVEVKEAAEAGRLRVLPGFGAKSEAKILAGIELLARRVTDRVHMGVAFPTARDLVVALARLPQVQRVTYAGSLRRFCPTIGDLDILAATDVPTKIMAEFQRLPQVESVLLSGETKSRVRLLNGLEADLRCLDEARWGTALQYFTGSQAHNVKLRELSLKRGFSLSEYSLGARMAQMSCVPRRKKSTRYWGCPSSSQSYARTGAKSKQRWPVSCPVWCQSTTSGAKSIAIQLGAMEKPVLRKWPWLPKRVVTSTWPSTIIARAWG
jgi:DNA polymerase/3'-5' exonuclease PolX